MQTPEEHYRIKTSKTLLLPNGAISEGDESGGFYVGKTAQTNTELKHVIKPESSIEFKLKN